MADLIEILPGLHGEMRFCRSGDDELEESPHRDDRAAAIATEAWT